MKKTMKVTLAVLAVALIGIGCDKLNTQSLPFNEVKGKIFVSSTSGNSYKLGSVKIQLVKVSDLTPVLNDYVVKRKVFDRETAVFLEKVKNRLEILELSNNKRGAEALAEETVMFALVKGLEFSSNVAKIYEVSSVATTSSDADGNFTIYVPSINSKYAIVARDVMILNGEPQAFSWVVKWNGEKNVMLNNINMTSAFSPSNDDSVVEVENLIAELNR